jgi:beta-galactosidase
VMWDGWVNPAANGVYIVGHWNYPEGTKKNVLVVSTADKVELFVNGKSRGFGEQSHRFLYTFKDIQWQPGMLLAVGYDSSGKKLCQADKKTAGEPAAIKLTVHTSPKGLIATGGDVALVDVEVVDGRGMRCPTAANVVNFTLSGPAEWRGGLAKGEGNHILSQSLPVVCGINRVIIRASATAGKITLAAKSEGLKDASLSIVSKPFTVKDGLAMVMPADGLPSNLAKGPTPAPEALTSDRVAVRITGCTAGSESDTATASYDDNEETTWSSEPNSATPWIQYSFAPAKVNEVAIRLSGMRTSRYPIRITAGDKVVFEGTTPPNLGYWHYSFEPVEADSLKVEFTGRRGSLRIAELEIYSGKGQTPDYKSTVLPTKEIEYEHEKGGL